MSDNIPKDTEVPAASPDNKISSRWSFLQTAKRLYNAGQERFRKSQPKILSEQVLHPVVE